MYEMYVLHSEPLLSRGQTFNVLNRYLLGSSATTGFSQSASI